MSSNKVNSRQRRARTPKKVAASVPAKSARSKKVAAKRAKESAKKASSKGEARPSGVAPDSQSMDFYDVWLASLAKPDWMLDGLIMMGDQVILAGAPKSYKSLWASQLALSLALNDEKFLNWTIPKPRRVLFISLEMAPGLVGSRLSMQSSGRIKLQKSNEARLRRLGLYHLFDIRGRRSVNILDQHDFNALKAEIDEIDPDLVIFDSLVRFHKEDENSNIGMSDVMERMRRVCLVDPVCAAETTGQYTLEEAGIAPQLKSHLPEASFRTSLILHHSRKESQFGSRDYSAASMRGASAIHSEVDLVIATFPVSKGDQISMNFSARKVREPDYEILEPNEDLQLIIVPKKQTSQIDIIGERVDYVAIALKNLGRGKFHKWDDIKDEAFKAGCPIPKSGKIPKGETFSKQFSKLLDGIVETQPVGRGFVVRISEGAEKMDPDEIGELIRANRENQNQNPS